MSRLSDDEISRQSVAGLWALAEHFSASDPIKSIIFLHAALNAGLSEVDEVRTRVRAAQLLLQHTRNTQDAREHLNRALTLCAADSELSELKIQTIYLFYIADSKERNIKSMRQKLERGIDAAANFPRWRSVFLIKAAQAAVLDGDLESAAVCLRKGLNYSQLLNNRQYEAAFRLALAQLFLHRRDFKSLQEQLDLIESLTERLYRDALKSNRSDANDRSVLLLQYDSDDDQYCSERDEDENEAETPPGTTAPARAASAGFLQSTEWEGASVGMDINTMRAHFLILKFLLYIRNGNYKATSNVAYLGHLQHLSKVIVIQYEAQADPGSYVWLHPLLLASVAHLIASICHQSTSNLLEVTSNLSDGLLYDEELFLGQFVSGEGQIPQDLLPAGKCALQIKFALLESAFFLRMGSAAFDTACKTLLEAFTLYRDYGASFATSGGAREACALNFMTGCLFSSVDRYDAALRHFSSAAEIGLALNRTEPYDKFALALLFQCLIHLRRNHHDRAAVILSTYGKVLEQHPDAAVRSVQHLMDGLLRFHMEQGAEAKERLLKAGTDAALLARHRTLTTTASVLLAACHVRFDERAPDQHLTNVLNSVKVFYRTGDFVSLNHALGVLARTCWPENASWPACGDCVAHFFIFPFIVEMYQLQGDPSNQGMQLSAIAFNNKQLHERKSKAEDLLNQVESEFIILLSDNQLRKYKKKKRLEALALEHQNQQAEQTA